MKMGYLVQKVIIKMILLVDKFWLSLKKMTEHNEFLPVGQGSLWQPFCGVQVRPSPVKPDGHGSHWAPSTESWHRTSL